jgi:hypothetical protein
MKLSKFWPCLMIGMLLSACAGPVGEDEDDAVEADQAAQAVTALRITGDWAVSRWQGQVTTMRGSIAEHHRVDLRAEAGDPRGTMTFDLDADGNGRLRASARCQLGDFLPPGGPPAQPTGGSAAIVGGAFGAISLLIDLARLLSCDPSVPVTKEIQVFRRTDFFGRSEQRLAANVGVYGERAGVTAADAECRQLRGARWLSLSDGGVACIGFADAQARTLKMMLQRPGEIYVQRLLLRRPNAP